MNNNDPKVMETYRSFMLMAELGKGEPLSQRDLSRRLGIALGLVNSYLKHLVTKGFVRVRNFPRNRYAYLLTPRGMAEKSRLAYQHLGYFSSLYTVARQDYLDLFQQLREQGVASVSFCGVDEVAEIAYLSLSVSGITLDAVMDDNVAGEDFFGRLVLPVSPDLIAAGQRIVMTSLKRGKALQEQLLAMGAVKENISTITGV
jgi:DNA-binding MarR family transcriptional regulator